MTTQIAIVLALLFVAVVLFATERNSDRDRCSLTKISPSRLLMPLAFGAILGGTCMRIETSTNLAVSGALPRYGIAPFTMFELTRVGVAIVAIGVLYMLLLGVRLLPGRQPAQSLTEQYHVRQYITEIIVLNNSPLIGKTLAETRISDELDLTVVWYASVQTEALPNFCTD